MKWKAIEFTQKLEREDIIQIPEDYHAELRAVPEVRVILLYAEEAPVTDWELEAFQRFVEADKINPMPIDGK